LGIGGGCDSGLPACSAIDDLHSVGSQELFTDDMLGSEEWAPGPSSAIPSRLRTVSTGQKVTTTVVTTSQQLLSTVVPETRSIQSKRTISKSERDREFKKIGDWNEMQFKLLTSISDSLKELVELKKLKYSKK